MLHNGKWVKDWDPYQKTSNSGEFVRQTSEFRHWITPTGEAGPTGDTGFVAEKNRYHLYISYVCPWACRTLMVRTLKQLEDYISISVVEPFLTDEGWNFGHYSGSDHIDPLYGFNYIHQLYSYANPLYSGRATVPVLWDKKLNTIVNNESADIIEMLNTAFDHITNNKINLRPQEKIDELLDLNNFIYHEINNGVYKAGFAKSQEAYQSAYSHLFDALSVVEQKLSTSKYLLGEEISEADIRLFVTLIRFDAAYYSLFKCNKKHIADYPFLSLFIKNIIKIPGVKHTINIDHIKTGYYSVKALNPTGIVPIGPELAISTLQE